MKIETLKELIENDYDRCENISQFKNEVFRLLDVFDNDYEPMNIHKPSSQHFDEVYKKLTESVQPDSEIDKLTKILKQRSWSSK
jgi:hypothetical protein